MRADTALVVIDAQYNQCINGNFDAVEEALYNIRRIRKVFTAAGKPVFLVMNAPPHSGPDAHINGDCRLYEPDLTGHFEIVRKWANSALSERKGDAELQSVRSPLYARLRQDYPKVKHLVLAGFNLGSCVYATACDARKFRIKTTVLSDCTDNSYQDAPHDLNYAAHKLEVLEYMLDIGVSVRTSDSMIRRLCAVPANRPARPGSLTPAG